MGTYTVGVPGLFSLDGMHKGKFGDHRSSVVLVESGRRQVWLSYYGITSVLAGVQYRERVEKAV